MTDKDAAISFWIGEPDLKLLKGNRTSTLRSMIIHAPMARIGHAASARNRCRSGIGFYEALASNRSTMLIS